jgi:hypothetical protein
MFKPRVLNCSVKFRNSPKKIFGAINSAPHGLGKKTNGRKNDEAEEGKSAESLA